MKARMALMTVMALVLVLSLALISSLSMAQESALQAPLDTAAATPLSTSFTYQGELRKDGDLVNGICDFRFLLYDSEHGGSQIGPTLDRVGLAVAIDHQIGVGLTVRSLEQLGIGGELNEKSSLRGALRLLHVRGGGGAGNVLRRQVVVEH